MALGVGLPYLDPQVADGLDAATAINAASDPRRNQRRLARATVGRSLFNVKVTYGIALLVVRIKRL